jgi:hypothetical protein
MRNLKALLLVLMLVGGSSLALVGCAQQEQGSETATETPATETMPEVSTDTTMMDTTAAPRDSM